MKLLRPLLIGIGILAFVLIVALVLALLPSVQTWAARRVIAGDPSLGVTQLGRVSVGLNRIEVTDVVVNRPGLNLTLPSAVIELPLLSAARSDIQLKNLVAKGWTLDLTAPASPSASPSPSSSAQEKPAEPFRFEGVFKLLELPVDLAVGSADLDGTVIFPTKTGQPAGRAKFTVSGGQLAAGREGVFKITNEATLPDGLAPVTRLTTQSTLALRMDTPRTFTRIAVTNEAHVTGPGLPQGARLQSETTLSRESGRESYAVLLKTISAGSEKKLVALTITNPGEAKPFAGTWTFDVSDTDLSPFTLGHTLPAFALGAGGDFQADQRFQEIKLSGKTDLSTENLDSVYAGLSALGRLRVQSDFDLLYRAAGIRVNRFAFDLSGASPVLAVKVLQAMEVVPATGEIKVAAPEADLVQISLKGLPLAWAKPFAPADLAVTGNDVRGELVARADQGGFAVRTVSPVQIDKLTVVQAGKELVRALDLSVALAGSHTPAGWQADVSEIAARSGGATLLTLAVKAGQPSGANQPIKATGRLRADIPALLAQPAAKEFSVLSRGTADFEFSASVADALQQLSLKLGVTSLRSKDGKDLPAVSSDLRADVHADGRIELNVPLVFDLAGRKSDLDLSGSLKTSTTGLALDAQLLSRELYVEDLQTFAALQPASTAPVPQPQTKPSPTSTPPTAPAPDQKPIWDGITGNVKLALKKVVYAANQPPVEVSTSVKISPDVLTLESLNAVFPDGAAAKVDGVIKFQPGEAEPYDVSTNVSATNFDPQPFLKAANPGKPPTVEGKFDLMGKLSGRATSLDKLADTANLDAQLVSRGGQFNGFATSALAANAGKGQELISKGGGLLSLAGSMLGKSELARAGEKTRAYSDTIKRLVNFNFDQLNIDIAHRAGAATTEIKNFSILSPDMRLLGLGSIDSKSGLKSILQSAMNLDLQMAVRGAQADDLRILDLLRKEADELGYTALLERFSVKGTPSQPNAMELIQQIIAKIR
ncbi:hypothetical protein CMV30_01205 [Nibricoccus aquaticus]|uniref:Uncharacterized protein n=1 Tax=Nibricoccus aquaticus TaxID=2576891 RepID=A0A290Q216_9BACT|nr:AsmA-like C-terminal region-containing protein [Nibricoccus aquaticus]ATC62695.1 hypothetical protein CMV30_01205 [Nibricoccus aquaticus]